MKRKQILDRIQHPKQRNLGSLGVALLNQARKG